MNEWYKYQNVKMEDSKTSNNIFSHNHNTEQAVKDDRTHIIFCVNSGQRNGAEE
jgi:hypothetical protein